jgi:hypothetical protein
VRTFEELQADLATAVAANRQGSGVPHVVIALPSYSITESLLSHHGERVFALEHRYLLSSLMTHRLPDAEWLYLSSLAPSEEMLSYYQHLGPRPDGFRARTHLVTVGGEAQRSIAAKSLDRPDLMAEVRRLVGGRPAFIEPWNVTAYEVAVAEALQLPINGMNPRLWHLGFKSEGRRLFTDAGVPVPRGVEDVRTVEDVVSALAAVRAAVPGLAAVVVKHDDSGAGDGNVVIDLREPAGDPAGAPADEDTVRQRVAALPGWYLHDLLAGGVVEEFLSGVEFTSPSVQLEILPDGHAFVLATHEQVLGGESGQVFLGCRFPASSVYAAELARYSQTVGEHLSSRGVVGRVSVDFGAVRDATSAWRLYALEMNLRKGGTTHPYAALRNLVPGSYDADKGRWVCDRDDSPRAYVCTDNCVDEAWVNLSPASVIEWVAAAGLRFDYHTGSGVVLHMLSGLAIDGRFGLTAIARDDAEALLLFDRTREVVSRAAANQEPSTRNESASR